MFPKSQTKQASKSDNLFRSYPLSTGISYVRAAKSANIQAEEIISLIRSRQERGMSVLYDQYADSLFGLVSRMLNDDQLAEDVLQKAFVKVWQNIESYDPSKASLYTWMSVIARNTALDVKRLKTYQDRQKTIQVDEIVYHPVSGAPDGSAIDAAGLLARLEEPYRLVLEYAYLKGYTQQEISDELGMPLGTVKTRLRAAIGQLRDQLQNEKTYFLGGPGMRTLLMLLKWI